MYSLQDIVKHTGLNIHFVRSCEKQIDLLKGHVRTGKNGKKLIDSSGLIVFQNIKPLRDKDMTIAGINEHLNRTKQPSDNAQNDTHGDLNYTEGGSEKSLHDKAFSPLALTQKLHETEKAKMEAEHKLELIRSTQKLLPAGGDVEKSRKMLALINKLEVLTRPKGIKILAKTKEIENLWADLKEFL